MPSITLTDPVAGTTVASGLIATNNGNLRTLLNSGLDYVNLKGNPQLVANETIQWDGTQFIRGPAITTSTMAGGPPGTPKDKDIWVATAVDANGTRWVFQYNAGSGSSFKWEFIGGSSLSSEVLTNETTSSTSYADLVTVGPSVTVPRAGDYEIGLSVTMFGSLAAYKAAVKLGAAATNDNECVRADQVGGTNQVISAARTFTRTGLSASAVLKIQYLVSAGTGNFINRNLWVKPVRIS